MNILHCTYSMETGGAETMLVDIINEQVRRGHRVTLLIINDRESYDVLAPLSPQARVVRFHRRQGAAPWLLLARLNWFIARLSPDAVHLHNEKLCRLVRVHRRRALYTVHALDIELKYCRGMAMAAITDTVAEDVRRRLPGAKVQTVLNGIVVDSIPPRGAQAPGNVFKIVQVARLFADIKGQDVLIDALGVLKKEGIDNIEATFIGEGPDLDTLRDLARRNGVENQVVFEGLRTRAYIYPHLKDFDAMVHPSRYEGFGLTVAEGMAAGLPLVLTAHDGPWEVADNGRLCQSVENGNARSCADALRQLMENWPVAAARAARGLDYVRRYDISVTVDGYDKIYRAQKQ